MAKNDMAKSNKVEKAPPKKPSKVKKFFREVKQEYKATTWPTKHILLQTTGVVSIILVVMGVYFAALDLGFSNLTKYLLSVLGIG
ncbi:MAG: preprotein translocase subunit SecE [Thermotogota bacterium]